MNDIFPKQILEKIKDQRLMPRPRWHFLLKSSVFWSLAFISVLLGGVALALAVFVFLDHDAYARAYLDETVFTELLETIPYFWLITLAALIALGKYAVRQTTFGYRYSTAHIVAAVLMGSALVGTLLHVTEAGERVQDFLIERAPYYEEMTSVSHEMLSRPEKGFLVGTVGTTFGTSLGKDEFELTDPQGKTWRVDFEQLQGAQRQMIRTGDILTIIGSLEDSATFRAVEIVLQKNAGIRLK